MSLSLIRPDWPAPEHIHALSTTRQGGMSPPPFDSLNLALHVGDHQQNVLHNRQIVINKACLPESPRWLNQVHGTNIIASENWSENNRADAIISQTENHVCPVMSADCLPILICDKTGTQVAAIHAGWRSLAAGIIEKTLAVFRSPETNLLIWLGPAIGPRYFEVGMDVFSAFVDHAPEAEKAFSYTKDHHFLADIFLLAKQRFHALGIDQIYGGALCTFSQPQHFFSYRRNRTTGRIASMIWISPN